MRSVLPREKNNGEANQASSRSDIRNQVRVPEATQGAAGKCLSRTQRCCALQSGEGRYGSGTSRGVEADTVCRKAIRSGTSRVRLARTCHVARLRWQRQQARFVNILRCVDEAFCVCQE